MLRLRRYILAGLAVAIGFGAVSCRDEDDDLLFLNGTPIFTLPEYVQPGDVLTMSATGVSDKDGNKVPYYWYCSHLASKRDTVNTYSLDIPTDTLLNITVSCTAFKEGYYGSTSSKTVSVISGDREKGSISGRSVHPTDFSFTDPRDGKDYFCARVGDTEWFKENLAYEGYGIPKSNTRATARVFGHYYSWNEAVKACPEGWRLPSNEEWVEAAEALGISGLGEMENFYGIAGKFMGNIYFNNELMWEYWPEVRTTNELGLDLIPTGFATIDSERNGTFKGFLDYAAVWTGDEYDEDMALYRYIYVRKPDFMLGSADKEEFLASVRCVRDAR